MTTDVSTSARTWVHRLGEGLRAELRAQDMTAAELANLAGVPLNHIHQVGSMLTSEYVRVAEALGLLPHELAERSGV
jgi:hypothetical protein